MKINNFIFKKKIIKNLTYGICKLSGRNKNGTIILYHRSGNLKKKYKFIDFIKYIYNISGFVLRIEYDSIRSALINLIAYYNGILCYTLSIKNLKIGDVIFFKNNNYLLLGCTNFLKNIKSSYYICLLELYYKCGAQYIRSAGSFSKIILKKLNYCIIRLKSKILIKINLYNIATLGVIWGLDLSILIHKKANFYIRRGWRPKVRGIVMNPIDHPHGGGGGKISVSKWGKIAKGSKTKRKKKFNNFNKNIVGYLI